MLNDMFKQRNSIYWALIIFLILVISGVTMIIFYGPNDFFEDFLDFFGFYNKETWVLLVAGSKGWSNYRHQADIAHAYQTLIINGVPVNRIIVMMTDDVAYHHKNPYPGEIFNNPNGFDVYQGLKIDYSGEDVSSKNFLRVLAGKKSVMETLGSGRVIESKRKDNIFVNFVGHGTSGILAFPDVYLYADELNITLQSMYDNNKFENMLLFIESCKAGSLFDNILSDSQNIFAVTASGPRESSWSVYCFEHEIIPCLGDEFSVTWIEDQSNVNSVRNEKRTILNHFNYIRSNVKLSNVMPYGDFGVGANKLSKFLGKSQEILFSKPNVRNNQSLKINYQLQSRSSEHVKNTSTNAFKQNNYNNFMRRNFDEILNAILREIVKQLPIGIADIDELKEIPYDLPLNVFPCYRQTLNYITANCFSLPKNIYFLKTVHVFFNLCTRVTESASEWKPLKFDTMFEKVVRNICSNNTTFSSFRNIVDIH